MRPLSMAEVWALPVLLRIVLLESLAGAVATALPVEGPAGDTPADQSVAACIRSLRTLETTDWNAFFEQVSETERILREDPAGVYARMDFETRDRYRKVVEELAARSAESEEGVAREAVRRARDGAGGRRGHVGFHLVDDGFEALGRTLGYRPGRRHALAAIPPASSDSRVPRRHRRGRRAPPRRAGGGARRRGDRAGRRHRGGGAGPRAGRDRRGEPRESPRDAGPPGARPAQDGLPRGSPGRLPDHGGRVRPPRSGRRGVAAAVAPRDPLARERRRQPPARAPGLPGRRPRGVDAGRRRSGAAARGRHSRAQREIRARGPRPVPPAASPAAVERGRGLLDGLGAQAREARRVQPPARRGSGDQLRRSRRGSGLPAHDAVRDHARRGHRAPPRRGSPPRRRPSRTRSTGRSSSRGRVA